MSEEKKLPELSKNAQQIMDLVKDKSISVYGPKGGHIEGITDELKEGDSIRIFDYEFSVFETPGHTLDHISYFSNQNKPILFCGDTLFSGGCGRLFEGTPDQMFHSLNKFSSLPGNTKVYCTHEYTCLLYTSPSPRDRTRSRMPSSA